MTSLLERSRKVKGEADRILQAKGLESLISRYGEVRYAGSYHLDLMFKKDIDITLLNPGLTLDGFYKLGLEIARLIQPHSMHFRNTRLKPVENRPPEALYWAFAFDDWNIDLWLVDESYYRESVEYMEGIRERLDDVLKSRILEIKQRALETGDYGRKFGSREVYRAVLECGTGSYEEFLDLRDEAS